MSYPAAPTQRIAYDLNGTIGVQLADGGFGFLKQYTSTDLANLNNEMDSVKVSETGAGSGIYHFFFFPEPYDLFGCWAAGDGEDANEVYFESVAYSTSSRGWKDTSGWTGTGIDFTATDILWDTWRTELETFNATGATAFRGHSGFRGGLENQGKELRHVHIYGAPNDTAVPDRMIALDKATGLEWTLHDWGDLPRGDSQTKVIQIKNNSASQQANSVTLGFDSLNSINPDAWHQMRDGGGALSTSLSLGNIAADTTYANDITVQIDMPSTASFGPFANRFTIDAGSWT